MDYIVLTVKHNGVYYSIDCHNGLKAVFIKHSPLTKGKNLCFFKGANTRLLDLFTDEEIFGMYVAFREFGFLVQIENGIFKINNLEFTI